MNAAVATAGLSRPRAAPRPVALAGRRQLAFARARYRMILGAVGFMALIALLTLRLLDLSVLNHVPPGSGPAAASPGRADIVDRNGVELARSFDAFVITVEPPEVIGDKAVLARRLAGILPDRSEARIYAALTANGRFRYIARRVMPWQAKAINDLGEPGLILRRAPERLYPNLDLGAHALGYTEYGERERMVGASGMERVLNARLTDPAQPGAPVALAMDSRVQQALESELFAGMTKHRALGAAGLVLDVDTGEVVAMASLPTFNPNAPGHSPNDNRFNRTTVGVYELGSTFKALTIAMAIDAGVITSMSQTFDARAPIRVGGFTIHDDRGHELRKFATTPEIFIHSSNIGTARMAAGIGGARQRAYLDKLGFFQPVAVELAAKGRPIYPPVSNWGESATMTVGFGHGISVSPLHLATAYAALVNGGILRPATMLKVAPGQAVPGNRVFSTAASDKLRALLRLVVTNGTGRKANTPGYRVGGKTGTAEKVVNGRYTKSQRVSTFAAAFPMDAPRYVVIAMLDEPHGTADTGGFATAGMVSAPIVERLVARIGPMLGVRPDTSRDIDIGGLLGLIESQQAEE